MVEAKSAAQIQREEENRKKFNAGFEEYHGDTAGMSSLDELDAKIAYAQKMFDD